MYKRQDAKYQRVDSDLKALDLALKSYERNNYCKPPSQEQGLQALVERPSGEPQPERWRAYLEEPMKEPWGADYQYPVSYTNLTPPTSELEEN